MKAWKVFLVLVGFSSAFAAGYFYRETRSHVVTPEKVIFVKAIAVDDNYPDEYSSSVEPIFNSYKMSAYIREISEKREIYSPEASYRVVSVSFNGSIIEEKRLNFVFSNQGLRRCELNSGPCPSPVEFEFQVNLKYSDEIIKVMLYKADALLAETSIQP